MPSPLDLGTAFGAVVSTIERATACPGPLAGLAYAAKDLFDVPGRAPTCGLPHPPFPPPHTLATALRLLDEAGAARLAYAEMTPLAYEPSGCNPARITPRNPWDAAAIPGGSSSGSAILVAISAVAFALGSDTGGSVRIPTHCCSITALKPSWGAIPTEGTMPLAPSLDTIGLMARHASDFRPIFEILAQPGATTRIRRLVILRDLGPLPQPMLEILAGLTLQDAAAAPFIAACDQHALTVLQAEAARTHRAFLADPRTDPALHRRLAKGLAIPDADLAASLAARAPLRRAFLDDILGQADAALLPVMPIPTPDLAETDPASPRFRPRTLYALSSLTRFVNLLGLPALALPAGFDARGRPLAIQIIGRPGADLALLDLGQTLQGHSDWHARLPPGP